MQVVDVSDPASPTLRGTYVMTSDAFDVQVVSDLAFVADDADGLQIIDVSDTSNPVLRGSSIALGDAVDVQVADNLAYVADQKYGLQIVDVDVPTSPRLLASYPTPTAARAVQVVGGRAYIVTGTGYPPYASQLLLFDVRDTNHLSLQGSYTALADAYRMDVVGDLAYVTDGNAGLQIIDVSNPASPTLRGLYYTSSAIDIQVVDDLAYLAYPISYVDPDTRLEIVDVSDPANPIWRGRYQTPGATVALQITGDRVYVADRNGGLQILGFHPERLPPKMFLPLVQRAK